MQYWQRNNLLSAGTGGGALDEMAFLHVSKTPQIENKYYLYWTPQRPILNGLSTQPVLRPESQGTNSRPPSDFPTDAY
jgi:hypothetical protein